MCRKNVRVRVGLSVIAPKSGSQPEDWRPNPADDLWAGSRSGQPEPAGSRTRQQTELTGDRIPQTTCGRYSHSGRTTGKIRLKKVLKIHSLWYTIKKVRFVIRMVEFCCPDREEELCQEFLK